MGEKNQILRKTLSALKKPDNEKNALRSQYSLLKTMEVTAASELELNLAPGGGAAVSFVPKQ